jgi:hypothetical protein
LWDGVKITIGNWNSVHVSLNDIPETSRSALGDSSAWANGALDEIDAIIAGDKGLIPILRARLDNAQNSFNQVSQGVSQVLNQLEGYSKSLNVQIPILSQIRSELNLDFDLDENTKAKFQSEIDNLNSEINKDYAKIAGIASAMTIGSSVIISTVSIGGLGVFLIPFMLGGDITGIYEIAQLGIEIKNDKEKIDEDNQGIADYTSALSTLRTAETDIAQFYASIKSISDNVEALFNVWNTFTRASAEVYSQFFTSNKDFTNFDWEDLKLDVISLISQFSNLSKLFKSIELSDIAVSKVQLNENMTQDQIQQALANPATINLTEFLFPNVA